MSSSPLIRSLPKEVETELRVRAARNGRSMEEARLVLAAALAPLGKRAPDGRPCGLRDATRRVSGPENGVDLQLSPRELVRDHADFSWTVDEPGEPPRPDLHRRRR